MNKVIIILLMSILTACSADEYTGQYEYFFTVKKLFWLDVKTGKETINSPVVPEYDLALIFSNKKDKTAAKANYDARYKKVYKVIPTKLLLNLKQEQTYISGDIVRSNEWLIRHP